MNQIIGNKNIEFKINEATGKVFCTSLEIAKVFNKNHKDILRAIDERLKNNEFLANLDSKELQDVLDFKERNFAPATYKDAKGENRRAYELTRDGFSFIALGLTGKKADLWKIQFINAFNTMEKELRAIKEQSTNALNAPKEVFNLKYQTPCRDAILNAVKEMEEENKTKAKSIREYEIVEKFDGRKATTDIKVGINWNTPTLFSPKEIESLKTGKAKMIRSR